MSIRLPDAQTGSFAFLLCIAMLSKMKNVLFIHQAGDLPRLRPFKPSLAAARPGVGSTPQARAANGAAQQEWDHGVFTL